MYWDNLFLVLAAVSARFDYRVRNFVATQGDYEWVVENEKRQDAMMAEAYRQMDELYLKRW